MNNTLKLQVNGRTKPQQIHISNTLHINENSQFFWMNGAICNFSFQNWRLIDRQRLESIATKSLKTNRENSFREQ